jgi:hypothetical protein
MDLSQFSKQNRQIFWDIPDSGLPQLSENAVLERVLMYGEWVQVTSLFQILGLKRASEVFIALTTKRRVNLSPATVNFFKLYFEKHAS